MCVILFMGYTGAGRKEATFLPVGRIKWKGAVGRTSKVWVVALPPAKVMWETPSFGEGGIGFGAVVGRPHSGN